MKSLKYVKEDVDPHDDNGREHGYATFYFPNGDVSWEGESIHGKMVGIWLWYEYDYYTPREQKGHHLTDKHYCI